MLYLKLVVNMKKHVNKKNAKKIITLLLIIPLVSLSQNVDSLFNDKGEIFFF